MKIMIKVGLVSLLLMFATTPLFLSAAPTPDDPIEVFIDGKQIVFPVQPKIVNGTTMVPMRSIFEGLGAKVFWENRTQSVIAKKSETSIQITIGLNYAYKNGIKKMLSNPPEIYENNTFVPLRFVSEALDCLVGWDKSSTSVSISTSSYNLQTVLGVTDGDTISISKTDSVSEESGDISSLTSRLRLIGINTPESVSSGSLEYYGKESSEFTSSQLLKKQIYVSTDHSDIYDRQLGYVFMDNGTFYNAQLVSMGYASAMTVPPDTMWSTYFEFLEQSAKTKGLGQWDMRKKEAKEDLNQFVNEKEKMFGFTEGEYKPEMIITRALLSRLIVNALFPEAKYLVTAKAIYDVSQEEWFKYYGGILIDKGIFIIGDFEGGISHPEKEVSVREMKDLINRYLFDGNHTNITLDDLGILQMPDNEPLTFDEATIAVNQAYQSKGYLVKYFNSIIEATQKADILQKVSNEIENDQLSIRINEFIKVVSSGNYDQIETKTKEILTQIIHSAKDIPWKDYLSAIKINDLTNDIQDCLNEAQGYLKEAIESAKSMKYSG